MTGSRPSPGKQDGVAAVDRALAILEALTVRSSPATLADIAQDTAFYKSTILRLLASLESSGYVVRLRDGRYGLGGSAFRLGLAYSRQNALEQHVLPVLRDLVDQGTESASFHVRHGSETRLCLFRVHSGHSTLDRVEAGNVLPLDRGAAGRMLLAFAPESGHEGEALRKAGLALSMGERDPSCAGLAAPVLGPSGEIAGALSLSGPGERFTSEAVERMGHLLREAAERLSAALRGGGGGRRNTVSAGDR
ncbi:IclR family transcriptional regulator [uncultured Enterovirga sp.]|uniref:IclR family transcriptional regulator n=1 Tax=uncultured Enterovirga sp. TaxID=2026352 RepID=UPI0035C9D0A2